MGNCGRAHLRTSSLTILSGAAREDETVFVFRFRFTFCPRAALIESSGKERQGRSGCGGFTFGGNPRPKFAWATVGHALMRDISNWLAQNDREAVGWSDLDVRHEVARFGR